MTRIAPLLAFAAVLVADMTVSCVTDADGAISEVEIEGGAAQMDVVQRALRALQNPQHVPKELRPGQSWTHTEHLDLDLGVPEGGEEHGLARTHLIADVSAEFLFEGWSEVGGRRTLRIASTARLGGTLHAQLDSGRWIAQSIALDVRGFLHMDEHANPVHQALDLRMVMTDERDVDAYERETREAIVDTDGAAWLPWMPKPSRQWQAPFFGWEVLEQRGKCLAGNEAVCEGGE